MVPICHVRMGLTGVRAPVWTASGIWHWKRLTKISGDTDCYYCINHMTCSTHVYYCPFTISDMLFTIMSPVYLVMLSDIRYTPYGNMRFRYMYTLHCKYSALCIPCILHFVYIHNTVVWVYCMLHICMFSSITHHYTTDLLWHDPMITCYVVMVLKYDMFIYFYCLLYAYYMVSLLQHHVSYIIIVFVLL